MAPAFQRMPSVPENGDDGLEMEEAISIKVATLMTGETGIETIETTTHSSVLEDDGGNIKNAANDRMAKSRLTSPDSSKNEGEESLQGEPMTMVPLEMATSEEEEGDPKPPMKQSSRVNQKGFLLTSMDSFLIDWFYSILIGALVVSYWRGTWVLLDRWTCDQPGTAGLINGESFCFVVTGLTKTFRWKSAVHTLLAGYVLLGIGLILLSNGFWNPAKLFDKDLPTITKRHTGPLRFVILYLLGNGTVCIWRGIWYLLDYWILPDAVETSYKITCGVGAALCYLMGSGASMLAPPAMYLMDGPSHLPPPIGVTIVTSYRSIAYPAAVAREKTEKDPMWLVLIDAILSYGVLPWGVVGFWRGTWMLMDTWLWGFTANTTNLHISLLWSTFLGLGALFLASEDMAQHFDASKLKNESSIRNADRLFGRIRTLILAFGAVNFWRMIWYFWDEFLGQTHGWSAALSHAIGIVGLLCLGCISCIAAPPSTLGVDAIACSDCADEPLFHNTPVPAEAIVFLSIARRPELILQNLQADPSMIADPSSLSDRLLLSDVSRRRASEIPPEVLSCIDDLLVEDDYVREQPRSSVRFTEQSASHVQSSTRVCSSSALRLSQRNQMKRQKSQFFRSR